MKILITTITAVVMAFAQAGAQQPEPNNIQRHIGDALEEVQRELRKELPEAMNELNKELRELKRELGKALPPESVALLAQATAGAAPGAGEPLVDPAAIADWANNLATVTTRATLDGIFPRSAPRKPIIVGGKGDAKANAAMEEDLNVMMRILEKTVGGKDESRPTAGGIELFSFGKSSSPRVFYIDGYGPMFVLNVKYPLLAPPSKDDQGRTNEPTNSEWEKAREEVYGRGRGPDAARFNAAPAEEFDAQKVEDLKTRLIEDLLNAKNIRNLKADDYVTAVVLGGGQRGGVVRREKGTPGGRGGGGAGVRAGGAGGWAELEVREVRTSGMEGGAQSTMTLRVKKSDVDKFAKEKQAADEGQSTKQISQIVEDFGKKVSVQVY